MLNFGDTQEISIREWHAILFNDASILINTGETDCKGFNVVPFKRAKRAHNVKGMVLRVVRLAPFIALCLTGAVL